MNKRTWMTLATVAAALAVPAVGVADPGNGKGPIKSQGKGQEKSQKGQENSQSQSQAPQSQSQSQGKGESKRCAKTHEVGYSVHGTLISVVTDNPGTPANEATVTLRVTGANSHARNSGEIADQNPTLPGVQVEGATYTVPATDAFVLKLKGYSGTDTPSVGDAVHVTGKIPVTKKKCAAAGTSTADRYGAPDVRKVTVADRDPDA